jgi:hypothetical protein
VWSSGGICKYIFFNPVACCFLYKAKDLSAPLVIDRGNRSIGRNTCPIATSVQHKYHMTSPGSPRWEIVRLEKYSTLVRDQRLSVANTAMRLRKLLGNLFNSSATISLSKRTQLHGDSYSAGQILVEESSIVVIYFNSEECNAVCLAKKCSRPMLFRGGQEGSLNRGWSAIGQTLKTFPDSRYPTVRFRRHYLLTFECNVKKM